MRKTSATDRTRGFTLLELLVVMAILVVVSAAIPLALNRALPSRRVAATTTHVVAAIRAAQAASTVTGKPVRVEAGAAPRADSTAIRVTDPAGRPVTEVLVFPDGSAQTARYEIVDGQQRRVVRLSGITGRVLTEPAP